jgi:hypothetical protein
MKDQIPFNRLTPGQNVPRPPFGDASLVYDSDSTMKIVDGDSGTKKPLLSSSDGSITNVVTLSQAEYDALTPDSSTLYVIV